MDPYLHLAAQEPKPGEIWDLLRKPVVDQELNPVHFFGEVGNCDLDITTPPYFWLMASLRVIVD